ncbi:MAG: SPOR domain-containing protein [Gemmatimonadota bacterium]|nr:SPOR domain-containing protein [Gemmatimonadota bacterium]
MTVPLVQTSLPETLPARVRRLAAGTFAIALFGCLVALGAWLMERPLDRGHGPDYHPPRGWSARRAAGAGPDGPALPIREVPAAAGSPADASPFSVQLGTANTAAGAMLLLDLAGAHLPVGTYVATPAGTAAEYRVLAGAFQDSRDAAALLASLRTHGQLSQLGGTVVRVPLAYMIEQDVPAGSVAARVAAYDKRGLAVYALRQADGRARVYAGAFAAAADTAPVAAALRRAGVHATLAYRTGRPF